MALTTADTIRLAAEIVQAGLTSESIKLRGTASNANSEGAIKSGEIDVAYLDTLLKGLIKTLSQP